MGTKKRDRVKILIELDRSIVQVIDDCSRQDNRRRKTQAEYWLTEFVKSLANCGGVMPSK